MRQLGASPRAGRRAIPALRALLPASATGGLVAAAPTLPGAWPLVFVALVPLLRALGAPGTTTRHALALGWSAGTVAQMLGTHWIVETLVRFSGHAWPIALALALGLWAFEGGRFALFAVVVKSAGARGPWVAPFTWAALEVAYPLVLPWQLAVGLGAFPPLVQIADLGGAALVSWLVVAVNLAVHVQLPGTTAPPRLRLALPLAAGSGLALALVYGAYRIADVDARVERAPSIRVGLVQAAFDPARARTASAPGLDRLLALSRALATESRLDLLVWPESSLAGGVDQAATHVPALVGALASPVLLGAVTWQTDVRRPGVYNSALLVGPDGALLGRQDKRRLLPFGEYVPFAERVPALRMLAPSAGGFREGAVTPPLAVGQARAGARVVGQARVSALVCYEDVLPDLVRELVRTGNPDLLANLTNDAWFGRSGAADLHLALARLRAVEHHRTLVRATNTGVTAVVDPVGRVVRAARDFAPATLVAEVARLDGRTPYATLGDWPAWLGAAVTLLALGARRGSR